MKLQLGILALCAVFMSSQVNAAEKIQLKTDQDKLSYTKGWYTGNGFKRQKVEVDHKIFLKGVEDALSGVESLMTTTEMVTVEENFQKERAAKLQEERKKLAEKNKKEGDAFLKANSKKEGVITLPSGLQYKIITEGKGKSPASTDKVKVNYRMTQIDGTLIEDTNRRPQHPAEMPVGGDKRYVPAGWTEALQRMTEGSKWQLFIPSSLGFGENGMGPVGPNMAIIFDVELVSVVTPTLTKVEKTQKSEKTNKADKKK